MTIDPTYRGTIGVWGAADVASDDSQILDANAPVSRNSLNELPTQIHAGVFGQGRSTGVSGLGDVGVHGEGRSQGVHGISPVAGVVGESEHIGVRGVSSRPRDSKTTGIGVQGESDSDAGVFGIATSDGMPGVKGRSSRGDGVSGKSSAADRSGVAGFNDANVGVFGAGLTGVVGVSHSDGNAGISGLNDVEQFGEAAFGTVGVKGSSPTGDGVLGIAGVFGKSGVVGINTKGTGVFGTSIHFIGVDGSSENDVGVRGVSKHKDGVNGTTAAFGRSGVFGENLGVAITRAGPFSTDLFGVTGKADAASGIGVFGGSAEGTGISGDGGIYGGIFRGGRAPLRLVPSSTTATTAPSSGRHERGELFVAADGSLFYCQRNGVPGTWKQLA